MGEDLADRCAFMTERLRVESWDSVAAADLARMVAGVLTARSTVGLPDQWQGDYSTARASAWIEERNAESPTLLVTDSVSGAAVGLVVLGETDLEEGGLDLRIGYVLAERVWGVGLGTELIGGLVDWARGDSSVRTLTAGVEWSNRSSVRVLEKAGFDRFDGDTASTASTASYRINVENQWDSYAAGWDDEPAANAYAGAVFSNLISVLGRYGLSLSGASAVDFGCGTGLLSERLVQHAAHVVAVDTSSAMLAVLDAKVAGHGWTNITTSTDPPAELAQFDLVACSSVCAFVDDYPAAVAGLVGLLRPGGLFIQWDWERIDDDSGGLTRAEVSNALTNAGLAETAVETAFNIRIGTTEMAPIVGHGRQPAATSAGTD